MAEKHYSWAVVGAGPAGIAAVGKLIDAHIHPKDILWLDPHFQVGDFGRLWHSVSSNTTVALFIQFLQNARSFDYDATGLDYKLNTLAPQNTCMLSNVVEPLQKVTHTLRKKVDARLTTVHTLRHAQNHWHIECKEGSFLTKNIILATGATPKILDYPHMETIPLAVALNPELLRESHLPNEAYVVFGSSHSAILVLQNLVSLGAEHIINVYRSPCRYALKMDDWILFDNTGLKGNAALWAKEHIDGQWPKNLQRLHVSDERVPTSLKECKKAVYATGFSPNHTITIDALPKHEYNRHLGILAPGLFGFGIAYPEVMSDPFGNVEEQVGLWKFMRYLNKVLPIWLRYHS